MSQPSDSPPLPPEREDRVAAVQAYRSIEALLPSHWSQGAVSANGARHHYYRTGGDRPPVLLLHGFLDGALTWLQTARALESDYDVILVDTRGHGRSDRISGGFSQTILNEDAAGVIRALSLAPVRLLGHSQGGATGIHVAAAHPGLVRSLIVEGWGAETSETGPAPDFSQSPGYQAWFQGYLAWLEQLKTQSHAERMVSGLSQLPPGAPVPPEPDYVSMIDNCAHLDLDLVRLGMSMWAGVEAAGKAMVEALGQTTCPVLIMKSGYFPQPGARAAVQEEPSGQPNVEVVRFDNTGHLIHHEQLELFITRVREFFRAH